MIESERSGQLRFGRLLAPVLERARLILIMTVLSAVVLGTYSLLLRRKYEAAVTVTTVSSARTPPLTGSFAAGLLGAFSTGLQPTPALISKLATSRTVVNEIARTPVPTRRDTTVAQLVDPQLGSSTPDYKAYQALTRLLQVTNDRETGLVTISVIHRDSALARFIASQLITSVTTAFRRAARAQATELRQSQEDRVDSAARQLRHAEDRLAEFTTQNRAVGEYSTTAVERERLTRQVQLAQSVYMQVVGEKESAIGKELEETPAVVVVDPIPRELVPVARNTIVKVLGGSFATLLLFALGAVVIDVVRNGESSPERDHERIVEALERLPRTQALVRRLTTRHAA